MSARRLADWQIIRTDRLIRKGYLGFAIWPFIFLRRQQNWTDTHLRHERIHLRQQMEMLLLLFFLWYGIELIIRRLQNDSWMEAYMKVSFEREAYTMEADKDYLSQRKIWAWWKWL